MAPLSRERPTCRKFACPASSLQPWVEISLHAYLQWAGRGRHLSDWLCPGRWQKFATFILGHVCPQSRWPAFATTSPVFQHRREGAPGLYFPVTTFQSCSARALYIYRQPWSGLRVPPNQLIFILPAYWILTSSYTSRDCDSWVISW